MRVKVFCPHCGKWLFTTEATTKGVVYVWCKQCRKEVKIVIEPLSR